MARYFFHVRLGNDRALDPEGEDFPDLEAAHEEALRCAREIVAEKLLAGDLIDGHSIEIVGEDGNLMLSVPLNWALRLD